MNEQTRVGHFDRPLTPLIPQPYTLAETARRALETVARRRAHSHAQENAR